jgi:hypothetical protein
MGLGNKGRMKLGYNIKTHTQISQLVFLGWKTLFNFPIVTFQ